MRRLKVTRGKTHQNIIEGDPINILGLEIPRDTLLIGGIAVIALGMSGFAVFRR